MPIVDFNDPEQWDGFRIWRYNITRRIRADIATDGARPESGSILSAWKGVPPVYLGFHRYMVMKENRGHLARKLPGSLKIGPGDRVLLYGDVYGWAAEALADAVPQATFLSCDPTLLTQTRKNESETMLLGRVMTDQDIEPEVVVKALAHIDDGELRGRRIVIDEDAAGEGSRRRIVGELGRAPDHIVTMGVLNFLWDEEAVALSSRLRAMFPTNPVAHIVNPFMKPDHGKPEPAPAFNWKHVYDNGPRDTMVDHGPGGLSSLDMEPGIAARAWAGTDGLLSGDVIVPHGSMAAFR